MEAKHSIKLELGSISFNENEFTSKLKISNTTTKTGSVIDSEYNWNQECERFGLKPEHYGNKVKVNGLPATIVDITPRSHKYPIIVQCVDGKRYKMSSNQVKAML